MLLPVAITRRKADATPEAVEIDYPKHLLEEWRVDDDKDGLLFSPVTFRGERVLQDAVLTVTALVLDYDDGTPPEQAIEPWDGYDFTIYTTHSHMRITRKDPLPKPKFRIVLPLAEPVTPGAFRAMWAWAATRAVGKIDPACKDLFRRYYWPARHPDAPDHFAIHNPGRLLAYADARPGVAPSPHAPGTLATKAGLLGALAALPVASPKKGLFAGIESARPGGFRQAENVDAIEAGCAFMAHARADAAELPEPEWYAALGVWARCVDGDALAHARSEPYAGYTEAETAIKLERAKEHGPATCARISEFFDGCKACPHFKAITSPVQLGSPDPVAEPDEAAERARADAEAAREALSLARARVEHARAAYKDRQRATRYTVDDAARNAECEPERRALEAAIEERDRAHAFAKSAERKARDRAAANDAPEGVEGAVWRALKLNPQTQTPINCYSNVYKIVRLDPLLGRRMRTNLFGDVPEWGGKELQDNDLSLICEYLADTYGLEARLQDVKSAVGAIAGCTIYNPAAEYLRALPAWDGVPRSEQLLRAVLHVDDTAEGLYATYLRKFMIAAVRRALTPGVKADDMLVLQGPQAAGKTTFVQTLFGDRFYHNTKFDITNKDAYGQISHGWVYEWGELSQLRRAEIEDVKNFLSSAKDTYRSPYAHFARVHLRHTVFFGTTNNPTPLNDPSGARRFWIIPVSEKIDLVLLAALLDQLWAEAVARADAGELHYLTDAENTQQRADALQFEEEDPRRHLIQRWLARRTEPFHTSDICVVLGLPADRTTARSIGTHLRALKCDSRSLEGGTVRLWCPPGYGEKTIPGNVVPANFGDTTKKSKVFSVSS